MATTQITVWKHSANKEGRNPIKLQVSKNTLTKYFALNEFAFPKQWDEVNNIFKTDKRLNPKHIELNLFLSQQLIKANEIISQFEKEKIDWTLNQFEEAFLNKSKKGKVKAYFENLICTLRETGHTGNANCYSATLNMLELFDKKFSQRVFSEIDTKFVREFDAWLQKPRQTTYKSTKGKIQIVQREGCSGNTRKYYFKALRAVLNKAIEAKEASKNTYPFGKGGFEVAKLEEETEKRYLPSDYLLKLKTTTSTDVMNEYARKLFLFSYFTYGMSFADMAHLTKDNIKRLENGLYIVYKRSKTKNSKKVRDIKIKLTDEIQALITDLCTIKQPADGYILPIVCKEGLSGEKLYNYIRERSNKFNAYLERLAVELEINDVNLTSYVSRHTMAMTLQSNDIPREVISQILGHKDLETTNTYLDSFETNVIDESVKVL